jgi:hypothetical protein
MARQGKACQDVAIKGVARQGKALLGRQGVASQGKAWLGKASYKQN